MFEWLFILTKIDWQNEIKQNQENVNKVVCFDENVFSNFCQISHGNYYKYFFLG